MAIIVVLTAAAACSTPVASSGSPAPAESVVPIATATPDQPAESGMELVAVAADGLVLERLIEVDGAEPPGSPEIGTPFIVVQRTDDALLVLPPAGSGVSAAWMPAETDDGALAVEAFQPACPGDEPGIVDLIALGGLARFCELTVAFDGYLPGFCGIAGGVPLMGGTPEWLYGLGPSLWIYAEEPADPTDEANPPESGVLTARAPSTIPLANCDEQRARRWYAFTAHFDDPAAANCRATWNDRSGPVAEPPAVAEAACRMILVIDSARPIAGP